MSKFYFTYSTEGQPFYGGWTEVIAENRAQAEAAFRIIHPDHEAGFLNCSSVYSEESMMNTAMFKKGNFGQRCQETIYLLRTIT